MILICYIFSTNKVFEIRLVVIIPLTTIPKFNWQLCLKLTDPNFAWFNSQSTKKVPTLGLAFSYLRTSILSVFYDTDWQICYYILVPRGINPSKFLLAGVCLFGGVREQTNKHTHSLTNWRFYRVITDSWSHTFIILETIQMYIRSLQPTKAMHFKIIISTDGVDFYKCSTHSFWFLGEFKSNHFRKHCQLK